LVRTPRVPSKRGERDSVLNERVEDVIELIRHEPRSREGRSRIFRVTRIRFSCKARSFSPQGLFDDLVDRICFCTGVLILR